MFIIVLFIIFVLLIEILSLFYWVRIIDYEEILHITWNELNVNDFCNHLKIKNVSCLKNTIYRYLLGDVNELNINTWLINKHNNTSDVLIITGQNKVEILEKKVDSFNYNISTNTVQEKYQLKTFNPVKDTWEDNRVRNLFKKWNRSTNKDNTILVRIADPLKEMLEDYKNNKQYNRITFITESEINELDNNKNKENILNHQLKLEEVTGLNKDINYKKISYIKQHMSETELDEFYNTRDLSSSVRKKILSDPVGSVTKDYLKLSNKEEKLVLNHVKDFIEIKCLKK